METNLDEIRYNTALKKVKKIKGFYTHFCVYIVINLMIIIANYQHLDVNESFFSLRFFGTALSWGVGLLAHGLAVFLPGKIFGNDWEARKIQEFMEKEKKNQWQ